MALRGTNDITISTDSTSSNVGDECLNELGPNKVFGSVLGYVF